MRLEIAQLRQNNEYMQMYISVSKKGKLIKLDLQIQMYKYMYLYGLIKIHWCIYYSPAIEQIGKYASIYTYVCMWLCHDGIYHRELYYMITTKFNEFILVMKRGTFCRRDIILSAALRGPTHYR